MKKYYHIIYLLSIFIFCNLIYSHDLWIEKNNAQFILKYGHIKPHNGENSPIKLSYKKENIKNVFCNFSKLQPPQFEEMLKLPECDLYWIEFTTFFWTKTMEGTKNLPPDKIKYTVILDSWESIETLKQIQKWKDDFKNPISNSLEIVPMENPLQKNKGDKLLIKVFYNKKEQKNIPISYYDNIRGNTDENGIFKIRLQEKGLQNIKASIEIQNQNEIKKIITCNLIFNIEQ